MFERMSTADFLKQYPDGIPVKSKRTARRSYNPPVNNQGTGLPLSEGGVEKKRAKFGNKKQELDGKIFDSIKEMNRYSELKILERSGAISDLKLQVSFTLLCGVYFEEANTYKKPTVYIADFTYFCNERGKTIIEDVKSTVTAKNSLYRVKKHMMKALLNLEITEI